MIRAREALAAIGTDVAIGYGVFAALALFVSLVSAASYAGAPLTLADLLSGDLAQAALGGASPKGVLLVLIATASVLVPWLWRHRLAPLAFIVPLLVTLYGFWPLYVQQRRQHDAVQAMGELGQALGELATQMNAEIGGPLANLGIAAWILFATVLFLALKGIARILARRQR